MELEKRTAAEVFWDEAKAGGNLPAAIPIHDVQGRYGLSAASVPLSNPENMMRAYSGDPMDRAAVAVTACRHVMQATELHHEGIRA